MVKNVTFSSNMVNGQTETNLSSSACPKGQTDLCRVVTRWPGEPGGQRLWFKYLRRNLGHDMNRASSETSITPRKLPGSLLPSRSLESVGLPEESKPQDCTIYDPNFYNLKCGVPKPRNLTPCETLEALAVAKAESWRKASRTKVHRPPRGV